MEGLSAIFQGLGPAIKDTLGVELPPDASTGAPPTVLKPHLAAFADVTAAQFGQSRSADRYLDAAMKGITPEKLRLQDEGDSLMKRIEQLSQQTADLSDDEFDKRMNTLREQVGLMPTPPERPELRKPSLEQLGISVAAALINPDQALNILASPWQYQLGQREQDYQDALLKYQVEVEKWNRVLDLGQLGLERFNQRDIIRFQALEQSLNQYTGFLMNQQQQGRAEAHDLAMLMAQTQITQAFRNQDDDMKLMMLGLDGWIKARNEVEKAPFMAMLRALGIEVPEGTTASELTFQVQSRIAEAQARAGEATADMTVRQNDWEKETGLPLGVWNANKQREQAQVQFNARLKEDQRQFDRTMDQRQSEFSYDQYTDAQSQQAQIHGETIKARDTAFAKASAAENEIKMLRIDEDTRKAEIRKEAKEWWDGLWKPGMSKEQEEYARSIKKKYGMVNGKISEEAAISARAKELEAADPDLQGLRAKINLKKSEQFGYAAQGKALNQSLGGESEVSKQLFSLYEQNKGMKYKMGGDGGSSGVFDCSGFVCEMVKKLDLPYIGRTAAEQYKRTVEIPTAEDGGMDLLPGDLAFFDTKRLGWRKNKDDSAAIDHVAVVEKVDENGEVWLIQSSSSTGGVSRMTLTEYLKKSGIKTDKVFFRRIVKS